MTRIINLVLLAATVVGGILAFRAGRDHQRLLAEHDRLAQKVGALPIADPSKICVRSMPMDDPLCFAWRVYLPPNHKVRWDSGGGYSTQSSADSREFIARVSFREGPDGVLYRYESHGSGSSSGSYGDKSVADLLRGRWDEIQVEQLGAEQTVVVGDDEVVTLLRLTMSDELKAEAKEKLSGYYAKRFEQTLYQIRFGSTTAFD